MKRILLMFAAVSALAACKGTGRTEFPERQYIALIRAEQEVVDSGNGFAFGLLEEVFRESEGRTVFLSPLSAQAALIMAANGAGGATYEQIVNTVGFGGYDLATVNGAFRKIIGGLQTVDSSVDFEFANSVWIRSGFAVKTDYVTLLQDNFEAETANVDFTLSSDIDRINSWCREKTHGMIPTIMDSPDPYLQLALLNALYFKGQWSKKFDRSDTKAGDFALLGGGVKQVDFMNKTEDFLYSESDEMQVCELHFGNTAYCMDFLLPREDMDFEKFFSTFTVADFDEYLNAFGTANVRLKLPKLKLESSTDLIPALSRLGITDAFVPDAADFSGMHESEELFIGILKQKAVLEMDENGAKAAAVTHVGMKETSPGPVQSAVFEADRPFVFLIRERSTGAILFIGAYTGL